MIYILNCDKLGVFKTFDSLNNVVEFLVKENNEIFDGSPFSLFGRGEKEIYTEDGTEWITDTYYVDSVVLRPKGSRTESFTFFIRCIDSQGNIIELD